MPACIPATPQQLTASDPRPRGTSRPQLSALEAGAQLMPLGKGAGRSELSPGEERNPARALQLDTEPLETVPFKTPANPIKNLHLQ